MVRCVVFFEEKGMNFLCIDIEPDISVDIVVSPGEKLPFKDGSIDLIVSTSCFEPYNDEIINNIGILEQTINNYGLKTRKNV